MASTDACRGTVSYDTNILPTSIGNRPISRGYSKQRILTLSQPKESKQVWITSFGPKLYWGDQDMMWPITEPTKHARPTKRLVKLAQAKKNFQHGTNQVNRPVFEYSCGRNSQIWEVGSGAMSAKASERVTELAGPKKLPKKYLEHRSNHQYSCGRVSPIWKVTPGAQRCPDRPRTAKLALPKESHPDYLPNTEVETRILPIAMNAYCSDRVHELARPKTIASGPFIDSRSPEDSIWRVNKPARAATASARILELSKVKGFAEGYIPNRSVQWPVSRAARRAIVSARTDTLATPIIRASMDHVQFNPDAFFVSPLALKARCTPRLEELAQPLQR